MLVEHLVSALGAITDNPPLVVAERRRRSALRRVGAGAVSDGAGRATRRTSSPTRSRATSCPTPCCSSIRAACRLQRFRVLGAAAPSHRGTARSSHHLVAFERAVAGTKERVSLRRQRPDSRDSALLRADDLAVHRGHRRVAGALRVRRRRRRRSCRDRSPSCGTLLISRGVPSRDVPIDGGALDLTEERGMLAANEQLILEATSARPEWRRRVVAGLRRRRTHDSCRRPG